VFQRLSALIPAAGNSGRMGRDKALLQAGNGLTFVKNLVTLFGQYGCDPVILVVNEQFDPSPFRAENIITVVNRNTEKGRSWSICLGLEQVPGGRACFIQNIDNPFAGPGLLDVLVKAMTPDGYMVPQCNGRGGHPILLGSEVADDLRQQKEFTDFRFELQRFNRVEVPYNDERILWNINTPDEYKEFLRRNLQSEKKM
jgi:CTP:molybdopterin cytidylyltransferase MocA